MGRSATASVLMRTTKVKKLAGCEDGVMFFLQQIGVRINA